MKFMVRVALTQNLTMFYRRLIRSDPLRIPLLIASWILTKALEMFSYVHFLGLDMSEITEGYLCPECLLNLSSEAALVSHFEKNHVPALQDNEVEKLAQDYKDLALDQPVDVVRSRLSLLEHIISSLLEGKLAPQSIPEIDLKPKLQEFLEEQVNRRTENDALILQLTTERDSALSEIGQLKDLSVQLQSQLQTRCYDLSAKEKELTEVKERLKDSSTKLEASENERHTFPVQPKEQSPNSQLNERLEGDLQEIEPKTLNPSEQLIVELQEEIDALKTNLDDLKTTLNYLKSENKALVDKITALSLEVQVKEGQIEEFEKTVKVMRGNEKTLQNSLDEAEGAAKQKDATIKSLQQELHQFMSDAKAKSDECDRLTKHINNLTSESNSVNETNAKLNVELNELRTQLTRLVDSENALKQKLVEMDSTLASQNVELGNRASIVTELESKLNSTYAEHQALMDQLIESQNRSKQLETALQTSHQELEGLQRIVLDLGRQNQALQITQDRLTNRQWVSDESVQFCSNCQKEFSISVRKHHCRYCGKVFCQACSSKKTATSASKDPLRVCDACFAELTGAW
ncbi:early endosome antigen 1 [Echinococcus multilocularis]|uniref:Early endosome antigen 1 n=1 Tax=Echinococcus multilocularis TaxID=6211 RepID=A0A068Y926_ECHMU|nr:early endosome antigen 1 [Echinococcus multilocularis]